MIEYLYQNEASIRLSIFLGGFALLALLEVISPKRILTTKKITRWVNNFALIFTSTLFVRVLIPTAVITVAYLVEENNWGLTNYIEMAFWMKVAVTFVLLDLTIYVQHLMFHALPILWRVHRVHHSDLDCDVTTGVRFHPIEIVISVIIKMSAIIFLGAPVITVILFEVVLNIMSMFTHSNIRLNEKFEHILRWFVTTPDMHRIHHSTIENETNSNFTFFISLWDRIFGTYLETPKKGHIGMSLGLGISKESKCLSYLGLLRMPFVGEIIGYAINHRDMRNADELEKINLQLNNEIKEKNKTATELILARNIAENANATKSKFISNMSHELRTPMHGILSFSKFGIKKSEKAAREKLLDYFTEIELCSNKMLGLIDDLLDLSKLESETIILNKTESSLSEIVKTSINDQETLLKEKNITINLDVIPEINTIILDQNLITQVIGSLLSNAIKFSPQNACISITLSNKPPNSSEPVEEIQSLYFSIRDEGIGIPHNELHTIFNCFVQSSRTETGAGGTGLGLAIAKNIIKAHKGRIWAKNNTNTKGATLIFSLPLSSD